MRDEDGHYRITGRVDDVIIVLDTILEPHEEAINEHNIVAESAIVGYPHDIKGSALYGYVIIKESIQNEDKLAALRKLIH